MELGWFEVSLDVQDIDLTREFYEKLGFRIVDETAQGRVVTLQKADCRICLYQGFLDPAETQLIFWQGDVRAITEDLEAKGLRFEKGPTPGNGEGISALLRDPDGIPIYFVNLPGIVSDATEPAALNIASCHCGAVVLRVSKKPSEVFECNCSICRRLGVLWAYYPCDDVAFEKGESTTDVYVWNRRSLEFHRCSNCGCTTHWVAADRNFREKMGVNARLIDGLNRTNTSIGYVDHGDIGWFWLHQPDETRGPGPLDL